MSTKDLHKVSMEDYVPIEEGVFRNCLWSQNNLSLGASKRWQYRWVKPDDLMGNLWVQDSHPVYFLLRNEFFGLCKKYHLPRHNAIAFWNCLLNRKGEISEENPLLFYCLICEGSCSYGDYFTNVFVRNMPQDLVWPKDIVEEELRELRQRLENQILREDVLSPERLRSAAGFNQFTQKWNQQLYSARRCRAWMDRYHALDIHSVETKQFRGDDPTVYALAHILQQYVLMLDEAANSKQTKLKEKLDELYQSGSENRLCETSELFCSLERIAGLLESVPDIALIAPIYVLALFREQLSNVCNGKITCIDKLSTEQILHSYSAKLYKNTGKPYGTPKNTYFRRDVQLVAYQILCAYFQNNPGCLHTSYDKELCNYMLQRVLPLVGECYFDISLETVTGIVSAARYIRLGDVRQTTDWVHPILQEVDCRLEKALRLIPDKIPHVAAADTGGNDLVHWICEGEKLALNNPDFVDHYLDILVLADGGIGNPELSGSVMTAFASLLDQSMANSTSQYIKNLRMSTDVLLAEDLYSLETGVHSACTMALSQQYKPKILLFLYEYLQSANFCVGYPIPSSPAELINAN